MGRGGLSVSVDPREEALTRLLNEAAMAHHQWEQQHFPIGDIKTDPEWSAWYSKFLLDNGLDAILDHPKVAPVKHPAPWMWTPSNIGTKSDEDAAELRLWPDEGYSDSLK